MNTILFDVSLLMFQTVPGLFELTYFLYEDTIFVSENL